MRSHLNKVSEIISQLNAINAEGIDEQVTVCALMQSVSGEYDSLITAMEAWSDDRLTLANVKSMLMEEYERKADKEVVETAFAVTMGGRPPKKRRFTCYWCEGVGHLKRNCLLYLKHLEEVKSTPEGANNASSYNKNEMNKEESARLARFNSWYSDFIFDSGASSHICNQLGMFNDFTEKDFTRNFSC